MIMCIEVDTEDGDDKFIEVLQSAHRNWTPVTIKMGDGDGDIERSFRVNAHRALAGFDHVTVAFNLSEVLG